MKSKFELTWWKKGHEEFDGKLDLPDVTENDVRHAFNLQPESYPGDCLMVRRKQLKWVEDKAKLPATFNLRDYECSVNILAG